MHRILWLVLLASCSGRSDWNVSYLSTGSQEFNSAKLSLPTTDRVHGMDVEFIQTELGIRTYLQVHSHPVSKNIIVTIKAKDHEMKETAILHEGGQRILLPPELQEFLLSSLKEGKSVTIEIPGYQTTLSTEGFAARLEKMENPPFKLPFKLPF